MGRSGGDPIRTDSRTFPCRPGAIRFVNSGGKCLEKNKIRARKSTAVRTRQRSLDVGLQVPLSGNRTGRTSLYRFLIQPDHLLGLSRPETLFRDSLASGIAHSDTEHWVIG